MSSTILNAQPRHKPVTSGLNTLPAFTQTLMGVETSAAQRYRPMFVDSQSQCIFLNLYDTL
jgi:hypothetical protein